MFHGWTMELKAAKARVIIWSWNIILAPWYCSFVDKHVRIYHSPQFYHELCSTWLFSWRKMEEDVRLFVLSNMNFQSFTMDSPIPLLGPYNLFSCILSNVTDSMRVCRIATIDLQGPIWPFHNATRLQLGCNRAQLLHQHAWFTRRALSRGALIAL